MAIRHKTDLLWVYFDIDNLTIYSQLQKSIETDGVTINAYIGLLFISSLLPFIT